MGTEGESVTMIHTASATSEGDGGGGNGDQGGGDGDSGGDQGGGDQNGDEGGAEETTDDNADFQPDSNTEPPVTSDTTEPTPELSETPEPSPSPGNLQELVEICANGLDDDNDGQIDADDSDCTQQTSSILTLTPTPAPTPTSTLTPSSTPTPTNPQGLFGLITPSSTPTPTPALTFQGVIGTPEPDCIVGTAKGGPIPPCDDPSVAQYAQTCSSVPRDAIDGGGFQKECVVNKNECANADLFVIDGVCKPMPQTATPTPTPTPIDPNIALCILNPNSPNCPKTPTPTPTPSPKPTPTPSPTPTGTPTPTPLTPTPTPSPTPIIITNVNNNQVTVRNGGFTVQNYQGAVTTTPDCPPQSATVLLGPSTMENGGARILASFEPCVLTDGSVILNLPDEQGIQLVAANIQGGQTTQSVVVPMQKVAPITQGQTLYNVDLNGQITGTDPATGNPVTLNGNINALFLFNNGGQNVEFSGDNSVALNAVLR
jgi:hypothetical protein